MEKASVLFYVMRLHTLVQKFPLSDSYLYLSKSCFVSILTQFGLVLLTFYLIEVIVQNAI